MNRAVVLDTNIIVSAGIHLGGASGKIVELILDDELTLFTCPALLEEYVEVLARPRFAKHLFPPTWLGTLLRISTFRPEDPPPWPLPGPDGDDLVFLSLAKQVGATLVTGNLKDYPEAIREGVSVVSPRGFVDLWVGEQGGMGETAGEG